MGAQKRLNLNWNGFEANLKYALMSMRDGEEFSDVTLVSGDGKQVKASKVILAGGSSFFQKILRENPHLNPHIYLMDVPYKHLQSMLNFLYTGQALIIEEDVIQFLNIADDLKIEGLILPDQPFPKTVTPLQNHISPEDHTSAKRKPYPPKTISADFKGHIFAAVGLSSQTQLSAEKQAQKIDGNYLRNDHHQRKRAAEKQPQNKIYHTNASHESLVSSSQYQAPSISPSTEATPVLQGQVSADVRTTSQPGQQFLRNVSPTLSNNTFPNPKHQDDTDIVKVEVPEGDANDFNDQGEQYISEMTHLERVFRNNANNYQDVRGQNLAMDQVENKKISEEEPINTCDNCDIVYSKAVGSEETVQDWYVGGEVIGGTIPVGERVNQKIKPCSVKLFNMNKQLLEEASRQCRREAKRKNMVQSKYDNIVKETVKKVSIQDNSESVEDIQGDKIGEEMVQDSDNGENSFQCPFCLKLCRSASELIVHKRSHTGKRPFKCSICSKRLTDQRAMTRHKRIHTGEKPFKCSICPKRFSRECVLTTHMRIHNDEKPYKCVICSKRFRTRGQLVQHERIKKKCHASVLC